MIPGCSISHQYSVTRKGKDEQQLFEKQYVCVFNFSSLGSSAVQNCKSSYTPNLTKINPKKIGYILNKQCITNSKLIATPSLRKTATDGCSNVASYSMLSEQIHYFNPVMQGKSRFKDLTFITHHFRTCCELKPGHLPFHSTPNAQFQSQLRRVFRCESGRHSSQRLPSACSSNRCNDTSPQDIHLNGIKIRSTSLHL